MTHNLSFYTATTWCQNQDSFCHINFMVLWIMIACQETLDIHHLTSNILWKDRHSPSYKEYYLKGLKTSTISQSIFSERTKDIQVVQAIFSERTKDIHHQTEKNRCFSCKAELRTFVLWSQSLITMNTTKTNLNLKLTIS